MNKIELFQTELDKKFSTNTFTFFNNKMYFLHYVKNIHGKNEFERLGFYEQWNIFTKDGWKKIVEPEMVARLEIGFREFQSKLQQKK